MKDNKKGLTINAANNSYVSAFHYVNDAERRLGPACSPRAVELIESAHSALESALHVSHPTRRSTLVLAARMAVGLALRELVCDGNVPTAA